MTSELKPCPHCGGPVTLFGAETTGYFVACNTRYCYGFNCAKFGYEETTNSWNRRAPEPAGREARVVDSGHGYQMIATPDSTAERDRIDAERYRFLRDHDGYGYKIIAYNGGANDCDWRVDELRRLSHRAGDGAE